MPGRVRDGLCCHCRCRRARHDADAEGLKLMCPDGSGRRFKWHVAPGRVSSSFNRVEAQILLTLVRQAMGAPEQVSQTHPALPKLRMKMKHLRERAEDSDRPNRDEG